VEKGQAAITGPVFFELLSFPGETPIREVLSRGILSLTIIPFTEPDWREAAQWTSDARRRGARVRSMDALIAFLAHKHDLTLLHADADMDKLARKVSLKVESHVAAARRWSAHKGEKP
jgi:predicted nucleic acid-binding protein